MKKILTIASLLCFLFSFAQFNVAKRVQELENAKASFKHFSVLNATNNIPKDKIDEVVKVATLAKINLASVNNIVANKYEYLELDIPYNNQNITISLYRVTIFAEGFQIDTDKQKDISYEPGVYYRGIVKGDYTSVVSFNFFHNELSAIISSNDLANLVIGKIDKQDNVEDYIIYSDSNFKIENTFQCSVKDDAPKDDAKTVYSRDIASTKCATVYFEIDHDIYVANGSNTTATSNWMTAVFNNVQTLYNNDGISVGLKSFYIWTTQDPYTGSSSSDYLYQFNEVRPVFNGDVGQLLGIDPGGLGGVAVTIDGLCSQENFSYSDVNSSYSTVPTYSWTVQVITHELGHLLGSPHTHACVWNGNNTAIDNCAPYALGSSWEGGSCMTTPATIPSTSTKGTIMSYCHLVSGVGIGFNNGFGPQPTGRIVSAINGSSCLSYDCINTCINLVSSINVQNITNTSATIGFSDLGTATAWQKAVVLFPSTTNPWTNTTTTNFNATGLTPNTYYRARVRPTCPLGVTAAVRENIFATTDDYCNGVEITDTGGSSGNYTDNQAFVRVISPNITNQKITLTFSAFSLELDYDYLYIYDGNSTSATLLTPGGLTGTSLPGPYTSTASDGSLTMRFFADQGVVDSGWVATTSCSTLKNGSFDGIDFSYYPNPTNGEVILTSKTLMTNVTVYNVAGQLLYQKDINDLNSSVDISSFATGTYFFKLKFDEKEMNFRIIKK